MEHDADCRWERTTLADCAYRATHFYCPHPEHACNCAPPTDRVAITGLAVRLRRLAAECVVPEFATKLLALADEHEAWCATADKRN